MNEIGPVIGPWCIRCNRLMDTVKEKQDKKTKRIIRTFECPMCKNQEII